MKPVWFLVALVAAACERGSTPAQPSPSPSPSPVRCTVAPAASAWTLTGTVYDGRTGISGARVELEGGPSTTSDSSGRYTLAVSGPGPHRLRVSHAGYADSWRRAQPPSTTIDLYPPRKLAGTVYDDALEPLAGAVVSCKAESHQYASQTAATTAAGTFELTDCPKARGTIWVSHPDFALHTQVLVGGKAYDSLDITMRHGTRVRGKILDEDGGPIEGAEVAVPPLVRMTDNQGIFDLGQIKPGVMQLEMATPDGRRRSGDDLLGDAPLELTLRVKRKRCVSGRVTRAGKPVPAAVVELLGSENSATTGRDGTFRMELNKRPSAFGMKASAIGIGIGRVTNVRSGDAGVHIQLAPGGEINGRIETVRSAPLRGEVKLFRSGDLLDLPTALRSVEIGDQYEFRGLEAGSYRLEYELEGHIAPVPRDVKVVDGETVTLPKIEVY